MGLSKCYSVTSLFPPCLLFRACRNQMRQRYKLIPLFAQPGNEPIHGANRLTLVPVEPSHVTVVQNDDGARLNPPQHSPGYDFRARPGDIDWVHVSHHSAISQLFRRVEARSVNKPFGGRRKTDWTFNRSAIN